MEVLIQFNYNNKEYKVVKEDGKIYFKVNDSTNLSLLDRSIFNKVINSLTPTNIKYINKLKFGRIEYEIFKDIEKRIYTFAPFNKDFLEVFNKTFNNQNEYVTSGLDMKNSSFYKRLISIGKKVAVILVSAGVCLTLSNSDVLNNSDNVDIDSGREIVSIAEIKEEFDKELKDANIQIKDLEIEIVEDAKIEVNAEEQSTTPIAGVVDSEGNFISGNVSVVSEEVSNVEAGVIDLDGTLIEGGVSLVSEESDGGIATFIPADVTNDIAGLVISEEVNVHNLMVEALSKNTKLTDEEKNCFFRIEPVIKDNIDRVKLDEYLKLLETVYITYNGSPNYAGAYSFVGNWLDFSQATNINEVNDKTLTHELLHMLELSEDMSYRYDKPVFTESINAIFNNEYFDNNDLDIYDSSYGNTANYMLALIEIIGKEPFRTFKFTCDISEIRNALYKVIPDENKYFELLDSLVLFYNLEGSREIYENADEFYSNLKALDDKIVNIIKDYYVAKYNREMETDIFMLLHLNMVPRDFVFQHFGIPDDSRIYGGLKLFRYYFNSDKANGDSYIILNRLYSDGTEVNDKFMINESNRYNANIKKESDEQTIIQNPVTDGIFDENGDLLQSEQVLDDDYGMSR